MTPAHSLPAYVDSTRRGARDHLRIERRLSIQSLLLAVVLPGNGAAQFVHRVVVVERSVPGWMVGPGSLLLRASLGPPTAFEVMAVVGVSVATEHVGSVHQFAGTLKVDHHGSLTWRPCAGNPATCRGRRAGPARTSDIIITPAAATRA